MEESYNFKEAEPRISALWEKGKYFTPIADSSRRPFSMYLIPPNASGPMHIGNALMIAIQDILARYHRAKGEPTLWIPGTDHGGYETQVTFEQEMEKKGEDKDTRTRKEIYNAISSFVDENKSTILRQIKAVGASVDWSKLRYTLDEPALIFVSNMFKKMMADDLVYRSSYMVNYCTSCATVLADIELKEVEVTTPLYFIKFPFSDREGSLTLATTQPEFLFAVTHVLAHPQDVRLSPYIGAKLINPSTGEMVHVLESKRKFDPQKQEPFLFAFSPSHKSYDFQYALRNGLPTRDLLDWEGAMTERYPGIQPVEARTQEVEYLKKNNAIESIDDSYKGEALFCKKGHMVQSMIRMNWFLKIDDKKTPLRKPALDAIEKEGLVIQPFWRKKGLIDWIQKMHDWPIARQNVWGINIPIWYEVSDPALFTVWFLDSKGKRRTGNLQTLLHEGISLDDITEGLERMYAAEGCVWTLEKESGKTYLPETDTFDTWFSSGAWSAMVFDPTNSPELSYFYPSNVVVIGYDLLRLSIAREIIMGRYLTGKLPFRRVYFHSLLKSKDGQKMSKSLGNAITLDEYLENFGADVTRMALVSYTGLKEDFFFSEERLQSFKEFSERLWTMGRVSDAVNIHSIGQYNSASLSAQDKNLLAEVSTLGRSVSLDIEKYLLASAQEKLVAFLPKFEEFTQAIQSRDDAEQAIAVFHAAFKEYLMILRPFMPFMTEDIYKVVYKSSRPLAATVIKTTVKK